MNKLPTKQIYLLAIIVMGIITLSFYSTYAIFTFEKQTDDIVNLNTPNDLKISENIQEYKQIVVPKNSYITTDIDVYNTLEYENCYSVWYKILNADEKSKSLIKVYQNQNNSSGVLSSVSSSRTSIVITNDNDHDIKLNIGISTTKNEGTCSLNISEDKELINNEIGEYKPLVEYLEQNVKEENHEEGYLQYNETKPILLNEKIYISSDFTYQKEEFILNNPVLVEIKDIQNYESTNEQKYYTCLSADKCSILYNINKTQKEINDETQQEEYKIIDYTILKGYLKGTSGIKKVTNNNIDNYYYFGDNPKNFIYYNCTDEKDLKSCELWRIVGLFYDPSNQKYTTKIVAENSIGKIQFNNNQSNKWEESDINNYLNKEYKINNHKYLYQFPINQEYVQTLKSDIYEIKKETILSTNKISTISLSDYIFTSSCKELTIDKYKEECLKNNWLNKNDGYKYYTMTRKENKMVENKPLEEKLDDITLDKEKAVDEKPKEIIENQVFSVGNNISEVTVDNKLDVRPVVYLKPRILLVGGTGTIENPYIIK